MRILQVINTLGLGGAEVMLKELSLGLSSRGIKTEIYVLRSTGSSLERELKSEGIQIHSSGFTSVYTPKQVLSLIRHLHDRTYDLIHVHLFPAQLWVALAAKITRCPTPLLTTEHNTHNRRRQGLFRLLRLLDRWMYSRYRTIAVISEATAVSLVKWIPETHAKIQIVANGINLPRFTEAQGADKLALLGTRAPLILSIGRFEPQKDHATLLRALARIDGVHLALVGDGSMRQEMELLAKRLNITDRVHFLGRRIDVPEIIKMADVYVQSSKWEGFGVATLEAMAGGLPVVVTRVAGLADLVGGAGLQFESGNDEELARHLSVLLSDDEIRANLAAKSQVRAMVFSIDNTVIEYEALYKTTLIK